MCIYFYYFYKLINKGQNILFYYMDKNGKNINKLNSRISKLWIFAELYIIDKVFSFANVYPGCKNIIYSPFAFNTPKEYEYNNPLFLLLLNILIFSNSLVVFLINLNYEINYLDWLYFGINFKIIFDIKIIFINIKLL
jgi:hypothetical protein